MGNVGNIVITDTGLKALEFLSAYRYLSVNQVAAIIGLKPKSTSELLLRLERQSLLSSFGNTGVRGYGKTPKVYYLTKTGHSILAREFEHLGKPVEPYRQISINSRWSPMMYHRLATLDVMMAVERDSRRTGSYRLVKTLVEYRREKVGSRWRKETTDYVADSETPENKIVPDAGFVLENTASGGRALFLIEVDCGTEQLTTTRQEIVPQTFNHKIRQYDRYIERREAGAPRRYAAWGSFRNFMLLTITNSETRMHNMREATGRTDNRYNDFYRFSTLQSVNNSFFHDKWYSRDSSDPETYKLIRGS